MTCGEQQPESDHFIKMLHSSTGADQGIHWRTTRGWFTYLFKNSGKVAEQIRVIFRQEIRQKPQQSSEKKDVLSFILPDLLSHASQLEIKITPANSEATPHIYEIRLLSNSPAHQK